MEEMSFEEREKRDRKKFIPIAIGALVVDIFMIGFCVHKWDELVQAVKAKNSEED